MNLALKLIRPVLEEVLRDAQLFLERLRLRFRPFLKRRVHLRCRPLGQCAVAVLGGHGQSVNRHGIAAHEPKPNRRLKLRLRRHPLSNNQSFGRVRRAHVLRLWLLSSVVTGFIYHEGRAATAMLPSVSSFPFGTKFVSVFDDAQGVKLGFPVEEFICVEAQFQKHPPAKIHIITAGREIERLFFRFPFKSWRIVWQRVVDDLNGVDALVNVSRGLTNVSYFVERPNRNANVFETQFVDDDFRSIENPNVLRALYRRVGGFLSSAELRPRDVALVKDGKDLHDCAKCDDECEDKLPIDRRLYVAVIPRFILAVIAAGLCFLAASSTRDNWLRDGIAFAFFCVTDLMLLLSFWRWSWGWFW